MQLPRALSRALRDHGHDAEHVRGSLPARALDLEIWQLAAARSATLITKDEDFVGIGAASEVSVPVVWLRCGNISNARLLPLVIGRLPFICATIERGARLIEIR